MSFTDLVKLKLRELEAPKFEPSRSGAHLRNAEKIQTGINLFDGKLIDIHGKVLREWPFRYLGLILPDKRYVAQKEYESNEWGMFTWDGTPIWKFTVPIHHDLVYTPQQTLLTITKENHSYKGRSVDFCCIVEFDLDGREMSRWSTWEHLKEIQKFHKLLELDRPKLFFLPEPKARNTKSPWGGEHDYYRINSIQVLPENTLGRKDTRFQSGNWLISIRHGSMLFIIDRDTKKIVWKCIAGDVRDNLEGQHGATLLANGNILIFDNGRYRGWSRVIEVNPLDYSIAWQYRADNFFTLSQGYAQRLPNQNTLITESEIGRVFEITREGEIVWEYFHPEIQNVQNSKHAESFGKRQWIYRMSRYPSVVLESFAGNLQG